MLAGLGLLRRWPGSRNGKQKLMETMAYEEIYKFNMLLPASEYGISPPFDTGAVVIKSGAASRFKSSAVTCLLMTILGAKPLTLSLSAGDNSMEKNLQKRS